jgi:hypothetical protein
MLFEFVPSDVRFVFEKDDVCDGFCHFGSFFSRFFCNWGENKKREERDVDVRAKLELSFGRAGPD